MGVVVVVNLSKKFITQIVHKKVDTLMKLTVVLSKISTV